MASSLQPYASGAPLLNVKHSLHAFLADLNQQIYASECLVLSTEIAFAQDCVDKLTQAFAQLKATAAETEALKRERTAIHAQMSQRAVTRQSQMSQLENKAYQLFSTAVKLEQELTQLKRRPKIAEMEGYLQEFFVAQSASDKHYHTVPFDPKAAPIPTTLPNCDLLGFNRQSLGKQTEVIKWYPDFADPKDYTVKGK